MDQKIKDFVVKQKLLSMENMNILPDKILVYSEYLYLFCPNKSQVSITFWNFMIYEQKRKWSMTIETRMHVCKEILVKRN